MKTRALGGLVGALMLGMATVGCSDDGDETSACGAFAACGGNVVGTWDWNATCGAATLYPPECAGMQTSSPSNVSETLTVTADGTMTMLIANGESNYSRAYTTECYSALVENAYTDTEFAQVCANMSVTVDSMTVSCVWDGNVCACDYHIGAQSVTRTSTYTTSGNTITVTEADGTASTTDYCVSGNTLKVAADTAAVVAVFQKR